MLQTFDITQTNVTTVDYSKIRKASDKAIEAIKKELPEDVQTTEGFSLVIEEMQNQVRSARVML